MKGDTMPREKSKQDLPEGLENVLPDHAKEIYRKAHNNALDEYKDPKKRRGKASLEEVAHKVAWAAVKKEYEKDRRTGAWKRKET
jgi:cation transport regulator